MVQHFMIPIVPVSTPIPETINRANEEAQASRRESKSHRLDTIGARPVTMPVELVQFVGFREDVEATHNFRAVVLLHFADGDLLLMECDGEIPTDRDGFHATGYVFRRAEARFPSAKPMRSLSLARNRSLASASVSRRDRPSRSCSSLLW